MLARLKRCKGCDELPQAGGEFPGGYCSLCTEIHTLEARADLLAKQLEIAVKALTDMRDSWAVPAAQEALAAIESMTETGSKGDAIK